MRRGAFVAAACAAAFASHTSRAAGPADTDFEAGQQVSVHFGGTVDRNLSYAAMRSKVVVSSDDATGSSWELRLGARAFYDFDPDTSEVAIRDLALVRTTEHVTVTVGFQQLSWGETLGFPVADIVNPRDLRDPLYLDDDWVKLPVFAGSVVYTSGALRIQAIVTPVPRSPLLPEAGSPFLPMGLRILPAPVYSARRLGQDAEAGARVGYLLDGWDLSAFFLTHMNRTPVFERAILPDQSVALAPVFERVESAGLGMTRPIGERVMLRADSLLDLGTPRQSSTLDAPDRVAEWQNVVEGDLTLEGSWLFSLQYEYDRLGSTNRQWAIGRVQKGFLDDRLQLAVFAFRGLWNDDLWLQPSASLAFLDVCALSVRGDFVWGSATDAGRLGYFDGVRRVFTTFRVRL